MASFNCARPYNSKHSIYIRERWYLKQTVQELAGNCQCVTAIYRLSQSSNNHLLATSQYTMVCKSESTGYKWVVLISVCFSQFLRSGFIAGTVSLFAIYYLQRYDDMTFSTNIGPAQLSIASACGKHSLSLLIYIKYSFNSIKNMIFNWILKASTAISLINKINFVKIWKNYINYLFESAWLKY